MYLLAAVHVEAGVEEGAVAKRLVGVALYDLLEVQLLAGVGLVSSLLFAWRVSSQAFSASAVGTELHYLGS